MAYTALEEMRQVNRERFGRDVGPCQPSLCGGGLLRTDLKSSALRFLHERCEKLRFDDRIAGQEAADGIFRGTSLKQGQIPYNMQMDINRLCLEKALERFIDSGVAEDAYDVYYCYLEIFFGHYGKSKKMVELLSEFESNGSSLLMKHRDHYSHSVYVFALGLAIYETNEAYRGIFKKFYRISTREDNREADRKAACLFLQYWGLASLFHDIGYPFELPFEQVMSYFEVDKQERGKGSLYVAYHDLDALTRLSEAAARQFRKLYGRDFKDITEVLAMDIADKLGTRYGFSEEKMLDILRRKPVSPGDFGYFMDHAFFSACRLYSEMEESIGADAVRKIHVDALSAIVLHNSLFKFSISFYKDKEKTKGPLRMEDHPLAYMLMLCDELQCWDRTAYGRNSRTELHPMAVDFDFQGGAIHACYYYDSAEQDKIDAFRRSYKAWEMNGEKGEAPRLKAYSDMAEKEQRFTSDIEKIVDTKDIPLHIVPAAREANRKRKHVFLSNSNFLHLYDFAVSLHGRNKGEDIPVEDLEKEFESLSLEYQLSTLGRAKNFSRYLDAIHCFYTDKPVDYDMVTEFTPQQAAIFAPMEHERWIRDHQMMGWICGRDYETVPLSCSAAEEKQVRSALREQMRCHKLAMDGVVSTEDIREHYLSLPEKEQDKDWRPFNSMLKLLKKFDGLRIYHLD
ncbi:MAG: hypothetical protein IJ110_03925 [Lachnospiraceae bacterium]|jgi:hypothetical protein|nr:hypothetical protein [Lachnospiraceae bacterium]